MSSVLELTKPKICKSEVLYGVSWEVYEELLQEYCGMQSPRFTYDSGIMEINMSNSLKHEEDSRNLAALFEQIAVELEIDFRRCGSTTYKRKNIRKGFEPDSCFYIQSLDLIEKKEDLDFENDPPPDLIIEINKTSSSITRMPIFAAFGVSEVWRFADNIVKFYILQEGVYLETKTSLALPILSSEQTAEFLRESREMKSTAWAKQIRDWTRENKG
ncbi:Uma2 family endonuclease [soil metagenome]